MITPLLCKVLPHDEIGWKDIGEEFTRFTLLKTPWFRVYLHRLKALTQHPECHDHPWAFVTFLLWGGYWEYHAPDWTWRRPGSVLYRPAEWTHNVVTDGVSWSLVVTGAKKRRWSFKSCGR